MEKNIFSAHPQNEIDLYLFIRWPTKMSSALVNRLTSKSTGYSKNDFKRPSTWRRNSRRKKKTNSDRNCARNWRKKTRKLWGKWRKIKGLKTLRLDIRHLFIFYFISFHFCSVHSFRLFISFNHSLHSLISFIQFLHFIHSI